MVLHVKFEFHSNRDTLTYFTAKNRSKSFICMYGFKNHIEASDLVHTLKLYVSWSLPIFVMVGQFLALWRKKTLERGCYQSSQPAKSFPDFFCTCFEISVWDLPYTFSGWCHTSSSSFIPIWTLWPTLQPKIGQSHLSAFMALKSYRGLRFGTHTPIVSVLTPTDFCHAWAIFGPLVDKTLERGS